MADRLDRTELELKVFAEFRERSGLRIVPASVRATMRSQLAVACCAAGPPTAASATPHQPPHRVAHTAIVDADAPAFDALTERLHALETEANRPG